MKYANVIFPVALDKPFSYAVPEEFEDSLRVGHVVLCSLRKKQQFGIVLSISPNKQLNSQLNYLPILDIYNPDFIVPDALIKLARWVADYYLCTLGEAISVMIPPGILVAEKLKILKVNYQNDSSHLSPIKQQILKELSPEKAVSITTLRKKIKSKSIRAHLFELQAQGMVQITRDVKPRGGKKLKEKWYRLKHGDDHFLRTIIKPNATVQKGIVEFLRLNDQQWIPASVFSANFSNAIAALKRLRELQVIECEEREKLRQTSVAIYQKINFFPMNTEQQNVVNQLTSDLMEKEYKGVLLWGVTGSGKTRVYLEVAKKVLAAGKQVLILVPEISLTPQLLSRFEMFLKEKVWAFHSKLNVNERFDVYRGLINGDVRVVVGARSAVFLPLSNPGMIVLDEEHETSYKQTDKNPRYHARDVALLRCIKEKCLFIAGSATPSMESLYLTQQGKLTLFRLHSRAQKTPLPRIQVVDLNHTAMNMETDIQLSESLITELQRRALLKEKALLFKNRRGYAPYIQCSDCGEIFRCPNCDISLTFHKHSKKLECHYCGHENENFIQCPACHGLNLSVRGSGTEKIEEKLSAVFANFPIIRMDRDTTTGKNGHEKIINQFKKLESGILLGTKMVTKGHDFENLTLVGVLNADTELNFPDFRALERGIQSLIQVSGRGGRESEQGLALLQSYDPGNPVFEWIRKHDYESFSKKELEIRKKLMYPPFSRMILFKFLSPNKQTARTAAEGFAEKLREILKMEGDVLGPSFAPLERMNENYRVHVIIKISRMNDPVMISLKKHLKTYLINQLSVNNRFRLIVDVDPLEIY